MSWFQNASSATQRALMYADEIKEMGMGQISYESAIERIEEIMSTMNNMERDSLVNLFNMLAKEATNSIVRQNLIMYTNDARGIRDSYR